jgi:signal peptidase I
VASYEVLSGSMLPTLEPRDRLVADKLAYGVRLPGVRTTLGAKMPRRGDIIVFRNPAPSGDLDMVVKRVIGLPGDQVGMEGNVPVINGWKVPVCDAGRYLYVGHQAGAHGRLYVEFLEDRAYLTLYGLGTQPFGTYEVRSDEVFVLGDDRANSTDSRAWNDGRGAGIALSFIEGRAVRLLTHQRRDGRTDFSFFLEPLGLRPHLDDIDVRPLQRGIDECLRQRPVETYPPPPPTNPSPVSGSASGELEAAHGG